MDLNEKINFDDFKSICRFCLKQDFILKPIFINETTANDADSIVHMISSCIGLQINTSDGLPEFLCAQCVTNLTTLNIFKNQCISSEVYLKAIKLHYERTNAPNDNILEVTTTLSANKRSLRPRKVMNTNILQMSSLSSRSSIINNSDYINDHKNMKILDTNLPDEECLKEHANAVDVVNIIDEPEHQINNINIKSTVNNQKMPKAKQPKETKQRIKKLPIKIENDPNNITNDNKKNDEQKEIASIPNPKRKRIRIRTKKYKTKPIVCPICGIMQSSLSQHMVSHSIEKRYECGFCDKRFKQKDSLKDHLNAHTGAKPYKCNECDKAFGSGNVLRVHKRTHTDERRFACHLCTKKYRYGNSLTQHVRGHTEDRRYECEQCSKMFLTKCVLNKHYLIHTGVREFQCELCPKAFQTKWNLTVHAKVHAIR